LSEQVQALSTPKETIEADLKQKANDDVEKLSKSISVIQKENAALKSKVYSNALDLETYVSGPYFSAFENGGLRQDHILYPRGYHTFNDVLVCPYVS
jgi:hypothetical protein